MTDTIELVKITMCKVIKRHCRCLCMGEGYCEAVEDIAHFIRRTFVEGKSDDVGKVSEE